MDEQIDGWMDGWMYLCNLKSAISNSSNFCDIFKADIFIVEDLTVQNTQDSVALYFYIWNKYENMSL